MLLGNGPDCSPQGFNTTLHWLLMWLQIESGHAHDFVSFCRTLLKQWCDGFKKPLFGEGCHKDPGEDQVSFLFQSFHYKYQTQLPWKIQNTTVPHSSHFTVVVHVMDYSGFGDQLLQPYQMSLSSCHKGHVVCVCCVSVCVRMLACRHHDPMQSTAKRICEGQMGPNSLQIELSSRRNMFFISTLFIVCLSVELLCLYL